MKKIILSLILLSSIFGSIIHPLNNMELNYTHVKFQWEPIEGSLEYELQLSNYNDFSNLLLDINTSKLFYVDMSNINWEGNYYWRVRSINSQVESEWFSAQFSIGQPSYSFASSDVSPVNIITNSISSSNDIIIYGIMDPFYSAAIDVNGNEIWNSGSIDSYMFTSVDEEYNFLGDANLPPLYNGELGVEFNIEEGIIWQQPTYGDQVDFLQHELIKLPNGNYMGLVPVYLEHFVPNSDNFSEIPNNYDFSFEDNIPGWDGSFDYPWEWKSEKIVEWDVSGNEVWSWNPFDYYNLDDFDYQSEFWEFAAQNNEPFDWTHFNAMVYDQNENSIYISSKNLSRITKIDKNTGNIIWNLGIQWLGDPVIEPETLFSGQHGLQILENGNIVIFDNGILSGMFDGSGIFRSSALEIKIINNNSIYTSETVWSYELPTDLYGVISGNVQKLKNGNYFVTTVGSNDGAHSLEITDNGNIVWECNYNIGTPQGAIYRSMKIPGLYKNECSNLGDLNNDNLFNVLDIVTLANCVLSEDCEILENGCAGDMNLDEQFNVLDIVTLANCVLQENCSEI